MADRIIVAGAVAVAVAAIIAACIIRAAAIIRRAAIIPATVPAAMVGLGGAGKDEQRPKRRRGAED
jgi:hypothetical protein